MVKMTISPFFVVIFVVESKVLDKGTFFKKKSKKQNII